LAQLDSLVAALVGADCYVSPEAAREAFDTRSMFNAIDLTTGWKIDLILLKGRPFDAEAFRRRVERQTLGQRVPVPRCRAGCRNAMAAARRGVPPPLG
jgi:hypothetical protein